MSILEKVLAFQGYPIESSKREVEEIIQLDPVTFKDWQLNQRKIIFKHHYTNNNWYESIVGKNNIKWDDIPILQKKNLQLPIKQLLSKPYRRGNVYLGNTSGSSGHPFYFAKDKRCHAFTWANIIHQYRVYGIEIAHHQARFYGIPHSGTSHWKERLKDLIGNRTRFPVFDLSDKKFDEWLKRFKNGKFDYAYGYTSALVYFSRYCIEKGVQIKEICPSLKACIVTSETCLKEDRYLLFEAFGVPILNEYGASETDVLAFQEETNNWKICGSNVFLEIVDDEGRRVPDGIEGRILVTSLHNKAMPFIRYEIGDLGIMGRDNNGLPVLKQLSGRINDKVCLPSGRSAAGLTFYYISRTLLEGGGILKEFIIRQIALDTFLFEIVAERDLLPKEVGAIQRQMDNYLEPGLKLVIRRVREIKRSNTGKIKHFFSEIQ